MNFNFCYLAPNTYVNLDILIYLIVPVTQFFRPGKHQVLLLSINDGYTRREESESADKVDIKPAINEIV